MGTDEDRDEQLLVSNLRLDRVISSEQHRIGSARRCHTLAADGRA